MKIFGGRQPIQTNMPIEEIKQKVAQARWYHSFEIASGVITPGILPTNPKQTLDGLKIPRDLQGKRVLEIGTWDGPLAFELEARGAEVIALDIHDPDHTGFNTAKQILQSNVTYVRGSVYDLSSILSGKFDIIFFFGVFYHLKCPVLAFEEIQKMVSDDGLVLFEGECLRNYAETVEGQPVADHAFIAAIANSDVPLTLFYSEKYKNDSSNWFIPNLACFRSWLNTAGLEIIAEWIVEKADQKPYPQQRIVGKAKKVRESNLQEHGVL